MIDNPYLFLTLLPLAGYVIGSTPFGVIIARAKGVDLAVAGSGNVGATNVGRAVGRGWGYLCFLLDVAKGLAPVLLAWAVLHGSPDFPTALHQVAWLGAGCGAVLGHVFSFWLKFRGGKGVATSLGVVLGIWPYLALPGLAALGIWIAVTLIWRYVSLGSIAAAAAFVPLFVAFNCGRVSSLLPMLVFAVAMVVLIIVRHRGNIRRLLSGTENKIGRK